MSPKFVEVSPIGFEFTPTVMLAKLQIKNTTNGRVAWRLRCNSPFSYIVNPTYGFLSEAEAVTVSIELVEATKHGHREHRFLLQAMKAERTDVNKRKVWLTERAQQLTDIQHVRIRSVFRDCFASLSSSLSSLEISSQSDSNAICSSMPSSSSTSSGSDVHLTNDLSRTTGDVVDQKAVIPELAEKIHKAIAEKAALNAQNISQINIIKRLEMELEKLQYSIKDWEIACERKSAEIEELKKKL